jgi:hypothetical protein
VGVAGSSTAGFGEGELWFAVQSVDVSPRVLLFFGVAAGVESLV